MTQKRKTLKGMLKEIIKMKLRDKPILVWYDTEGSFRDIINKLGIAGVKLLVFDGSYLEIKVKIEEEDPELKDKWLIYIPEKPCKPSWIRDYELAGECMELSLPELYSQWGSPLFSQDVEDLLKGERGRILATKWDEAFIHGTTITKENMVEALLCICLGIPVGSGPGKIITTILEKADVWEKLEQLGITKFFEDYVRENLGLKAFGKENAFMSLSRALFLSELVEYGNIDHTPYEDALPEEIHRKKWADWLREWLKSGNKKEIEKLAKRVEIDYDLKNKLSGWNIQDVQGIPCVDDILFDQIRVLTETNTLSLPLLKKVAGKRQQILWKHSAWEAVLRTINVLEMSEKVIDELKNKASPTLNELFHSYKDAWYQLDREYLMLEVEADKLPVWMRNKIVERAYAAYREYLNMLGEKVGEALQKERSWKIKGWKRQIEVLKSILPLDKKKFALFLVDAMRLELAKRLKAMLNEDYAVKEIPTLASLPSITPVGMGALIPCNEGVLIEIEKGKIKFKRDGVDIKSSKNREKLWQKIIPNVKIMSLDEIESKELKVCDEPIIVYSQEIDKDETALNRLKADTFGMILDRLNKAIRKVLEAGYSTVIVVTDHGFLWIPRGQETQVLKISEGDETIVEHRYAVGRPEKISNTVRLTLSEIDIKGDADIIFPKGLRVFSKQGPMSAFMHGGYMPQESALITLIITPKVEKKGVKVKLEEKAYIETSIPIFVIRSEISEEYVEPRIIQVVVLCEGEEVGISEKIEIEAPGVEKRTSPIKLKKLGTQVKVKVIDVYTKEVLDEKTFKVVLPEREEIS